MSNQVCEHHLSLLCNPCFMDEQLYKDDLDVLDKKTPLMLQYARKLYIINYSIMTRQMTSYLKTDIFMGEGRCTAGPPVCISKTT